ncbi:hypothetical protein BN77_p280001 [Rhizobium mesoamericanum STM3625]|uniref:Uncharacterized protein n=1 Tax=Rhizobium mesoamericanum STM3625 TaxID=1211777 RepID=K0Q1R0_9HYPH|nr:hypothetical protein BN77_p280001 [Rhizobium mesoamericanum STM3625]
MTSATSAGCGSIDFGLCRHLLKGGVDDHFLTANEKARNVTLGSLHPAVAKTSMLQQWFLAANEIRINLVGLATIRLGTDVAK